MADRNVDLAELEMDDGHIRAMRTYYDPTQLGWTRSVVR